MKVVEATFCFLLLVTICSGNEEVCKQIQPWQREECGWAGITPQQCIRSLGCCFDSSIMNVPWCFKQTSYNANRGFVPAPLPPAAFKYYGSCLFQCTSVPIKSRVQCGVKDTDEKSCMDIGCCYDARVDYYSGKRCFYPDTSTKACPRPRCQMPTGKFIPCAVRTRNRINPNCESFGCCTMEVGRFKYCYREETPPMQLRPPTTPPPTTLPPTTATTRKPTFLEQIRRQNGGTLGGFSLYDMLTKSLQQLVSNQTVDKEGKNSAPTPPPTTIATTVRYTTPFVTRPPPRPRIICRYGRCRRYPAFIRQPVWGNNCEPRQCGQSYFAPGVNPSFRPSLKKIVGGNRAYPFSSPWTAMLLKKEGDQRFVCGAAIICNHWLVTAAHCMNSQTKRSSTPDLDTIFYTVYVGRHTGWKKKYGKQVQIFKGREGIDFIEQHEDFKPGVTRGVITNDIAVIRLKRPITFNLYAQPVCLPSKDPTEKTLTWATGWGITKNRGPNDNELKIVGKRVLNKTKCDEEVPRFSDSNTKGLVCAGGERYHDTCTGDSGGPLVSYKNNGRRGPRGMRQFELVGLTSLGSPNCNTLLFDRQPALYVDVFHYLPWIRARTRNCCRVY